MSAMVISLLYGFSDPWALPRQKIRHQPHQKKRIKREIAETQTILRRGKAPSQNTLLLLPKPPFHAKKRSTYSELSHLYISDMEPLVYLSRYS